MAELNEPVFLRDGYTEVLSRFRDRRIIKILSGIRRCGKSTVLELWRDALLASGVERERIVERTYTSMGFPAHFDLRLMYEDLTAAVAEVSGTCYLLLDEVQEIDGWEKAVNGLFETYDVDIYVTGSNSKLLSSEISTYLTGRFVQVPVYTLSFAEYLDFRRQAGSGTPSGASLLDDYIRMGGFPLIALSRYAQEDAYQIVDGIYATVVTRDIARRHNVSNVDMFNRVTCFVCENLGKTFSAKTVFDFFKGQHRAIAIETVYNYLAWLEEAFIVYRCARYDLQGKAVLRTQEKFYLADVSLKYSQLGFSPKMVAAVLENIVYLELRRRGYDVFVGKLGDREIDFVAARHGERIYVQVCRTLPEDDDREVRNLLAIKDNFPKYVVTLDEFATGTVDGVRVMHVRDFLLWRG